MKCPIYRKWSRLISFFWLNKSGWNLNKRILDLISFEFIVSPEIEHWALNQKSFKLTIHIHIVWWLLNFLIRRLIYQGRFYKCCMIINSSFRTILVDNTIVLHFQLVSVFTRISWILESFDAMFSLRNVKCELLRILAG